MDNSDTIWATKPQTHTTTRRNPMINQNQMIITTDPKTQYSDLRDYLDDDWREFLIRHWNLHDDTRPLPEEPLHLEDDFDGEHKKQVVCKCPCHRKDGSYASDYSLEREAGCVHCNGTGVQFVFDFEAGLATLVEYIMEVE